jgi:hypothetical protein
MTFLTAYSKVVFSPIFNKNKTNTWQIAYSSKYETMLFKKHTNELPDYDIAVSVHNIRIEKTDKQTTCLKLGQGVFVYIPTEGWKMK